jgi:hypothetical protein
MSVCADGCLECKTRHFEAGNDSMVMDEMRSPRWMRRTHDCALDLVPEAFPPDLPPVILIDLGGMGVLGLVRVGGVGSDGVG